MENKPILSKDQICKLFGCSIEQLNAQYAANAKQLGEMKNKAIKTGKKVNYYTASELAKHEATYLSLSK